MSLVIENCITMENGKFLCWDETEQRTYIIDLRKTKATTQNATANDWKRFSELLGGKIKKEEKQNEEN
jgi:hypothetical protein